ncbi:MAG: extracellular solute-binding protein [Christensenellales bacterium]|jgi:putative aldouronate transport system substrate-binding protein
MKKLLSLFLVLLLLVATMPVMLVVAEELPTLRVLGGYNGHDPNNDPTAAAIEEKTGYHVEYFMLPAENALQNLLMQIASGESYDILRISETQYQELLKRNALLPLDDLLKDYGSNLTTKIFESAYSLTRLNDKTYGIPMMAERASISDGIVMRKEILDELNLAVPTTPAELKDVLMVVKDAYPDMIPLLTGDEQIIETISSGFGFYFDWNEVDGQLLHYVEMPEYKEYLAYMVDLYNNGLLDADLAINTSTTRTEKFSSGNAFAYTCGGWTDSATTAYINAFEDKELIFIDPLYDTNGKAGIKRQQALNNVTCIPVTAANPEHAVKFMNRKLDEDVFTYITIGEKNVHFTLDENGNYAPIMPIFNEARNNAWWYLNSFDMTCYGDMWMARTRRTKATGLIYDGLNKNADQFAIDNPTDLCPTLEAVAENKASLSTLVHDYVLQVIVGVKKVEEHDVFIQEWLNAGGESSKVAINEWYKNK